jgi:hypothetical protein
MDITRVFIRLYAKAHTGYPDQKIHVSIKVSVDADDFTKIKPNIFLT